MSTQFAALLPYSPYLARTLASGAINPELLAKISAAPLKPEFFQNFAPWAEFIRDLKEEDLSRELRRLRTYVFSQVLVRDLSGKAKLPEVMRTMTLFADFACNLALDFAEALYTARYGKPLGEESGEPQHLTVIAMGKLGGGELNVSSDIDLIFTYPENGETAGPRHVTNEEFFTKVSQKIIGLLHEITAYGGVFRVDTRLRPEGDAGALCLSEAALEEYLIKQGREWERYAWIKARVVSPYANHIEALTAPFIYRKYLDFGSFKEMRKLSRGIRREMTREGRKHNIKLGEGGIREIEFIAQIFQLIRGGGIKELRLKGTRAALKKLAELKIIKEEEADTLLSAYDFLRRVEHRLQYWDDKQTQLLPRSEEEQELLARSLGYASYADFLAELNTHRKAVNDLFNRLLHSEDENDAPTADLAAYWTEAIPDIPEIDAAEIDHAMWQKYGFSSAAGEAAEKLLAAFKAEYYRKYSNAVAALFDELIPQFIAAAGTLPDPVTALTRIVEFARHLAGRPAYLAFLREYPEASQRLMSLLSQSRWLADYLTRHPILLDELLSAELLDPVINWELEEQKLKEALKRAGDDAEEQMNAIRQFQHGQIFRLAVQELEGLRTVEDLSDQLSALADMIIETAMTQVWHNYHKTRDKKEKFAVIAYGKLGGKELSYSSDLDLVYVYLDSAPDANEIYNWYASRLTSYLSVATESGGLYQVDLRLRPNGDAGFLATDFNFYADYLADDAWTWEHQALTRARVVCGDAAITAEFKRLREKILRLKRDPAHLKAEILAMRQRIEETHPDRFDDVKHAEGGITDVEFIVQYLVLAFSQRYPELTQNSGNIALLKKAGELGLINSELADKAREAYRDYRKIAHNQVLFDRPPPLDEERLNTHYRDVRALWQEVFA